MQSVISQPTAVLEHKFNLKKNKKLKYIYLVKRGRVVVAIFCDICRTMLLEKQISHLPWMDDTCRFVVAAVVFVFSAAENRR